MSYERQQHTVMHDRVPGIVASKSTLSGSASWLEQQDLKGWQCAALESEPGLLAT